MFVDVAMVRGSSIGGFIISRWCGANPTADPTLLNIGERSSSG